MMHAMAGTLHLGTSGFSFDGWKHGVFYPEGLKNREMLSYYSQQLSSVEINYTFRRFPTEKSLTAWREQAAEGFTFTLKANQRITHFKRLADTDEDVRAFLELGKLLGDKLGCVLFQCPPSLHYDRALIEAFVGYLPPGGSVRDGVPSSVVGRGEGSVAVAGRGLVRRGDRREGPGTRRSLVGADRLPAAAEDASTPTRSSAGGPTASPRPWRRARTCSAISSTRRTAPVRRWRSDSEVAGQRIAKARRSPGRRSASPPRNVRR